jgi:hypothetical protein
VDVSVFLVLLFVCLFIISPTVTRRFLCRACLAAFETLAMYVRVLLAHTQLHCALQTDGCCVLTCITATHCLHR